MLERFVRPITHPNAGSFDHIVLELEKVHGTVAGMRSDAAYLDDALDDWTGDAATNFKRAFLHPLIHDVRPNQARFVEQLAAMFALSKGITMLAQDSLMTVVEQTRQALREQLRRRSEGSREVSRRQMLILAAGLDGVVSVLSFQRAPLEASMGAISDALTTADLLASGEAAEDLDIEGATADELWDALFKAALAIDANARECYVRMEYQLREMSEGFSELRKDGLLLPRLPWLVHGVDAKTFRHEDTSNYRL